jgi:DNA-binding beta-propeller fold protein YncE
LDPLRRSEVWRRAFTLVIVTTAAVLTFSASIERSPQGYRATGKIAAATWPYLPGSMIPVRVDGFSVPYHVALSGTGSLRDGGVYVVPDAATPGTATLIAGNRSGLAARTVRIGVPPSGRHPFLAVVSYDDGIIFHDAFDFSITGVLATGGTPSDADLDPFGRLAATDTQGSAIAVVSLFPWGVSHVEGVPFGDEIAIDKTSRAIFVTNRDVNGGGALTRVDAHGRVSHVVTGETAEGLAIDERRGLVYVANVNDGTIAVVDARSMQIERHIRAIARVFSLALSPDGKRLYAISNQSAGSPFAAPGAAIAIALDRSPPRVIARSADLTFPLGVVLDSATETLLVTDEALDVVDVLDTGTLRQKHRPLPTCRTPWKPALDPESKRLYVPCARANEVDVFDSSTLRHVAGAPFATGSYPLSVAIWHPHPAANRSTHGR